MKNMTLSLDITKYGPDSPTIPAYKLGVVDAFTYASTTITDLIIDVTAKGMAKPELTEQATEQVQEVLDLLRNLRAKFRTQMSIAVASSSKGRSSVSS